MTIADFTAKIGRVIARLDAEIGQLAAVAGADLVALVTNRVVQTGESSDGSQFTPYSDNKHPASMYLGKSRTGGAENKVKTLAKKKERISYREFRVINGLNPAPVNFEFSGAMWRNFKVLGVAATANGVVVTIGGANEDARNKIRKNSDRDNKSIIRPSKKEIEIVRRNLVVSVQKIVDNG